jgi:hypothetical protein
MTPQEMLEKMKVTIGGRTGKTFPQWVDVARGSGLEKHKAITVWLKTEHGLNHNEAQWVAWEVTDPGRSEQYNRPKDLVAELYAGKKAHLRPIYDALLAAGMGVGTDIKPNVCKTYTSLAAGRQFAILNPRTQKGVDLELRLPDGAKWGDAFKSSNPNFKRRMRLTDVSQVDGAVTGALAAAAAHVRK